MEESMKINKYIDIDILQTILVNMSKATGIAFVVVDLKGNPVTEPVGFTKFCNYLRKIDEYKEICYQCDAHGGLHANIKGEPYVYKCHSGLVDFAVPIMVNGNYLGAILSGQVKVEDENTKKLTSIINSNVSLEIEKNEELKNAYDEINEIPYSKIEATAITIHEIANYIVEKAYVNSVKKELNENQLRLLKEEKIRNELEKSLKDAELQALYYQINPHFLFNALNTICRLAYLEKAVRTEDIAFAFSDMMKYVLNKNHAELVTIKDELEHCNNYLKIQKLRMGDRLNYNINCSDRYNDVICPFMILQPMIENIIKYVAEVKVEGANIDINAYDDGNNLIIDIKDDGDGIPKEKIQKLLNITENYKLKEESIGINNVNKRLIYMFGEKYGLEIQSSNKPKEGTLVRIKLNLNLNRKID
jgi:LytS/YehU family sensor histidine kinase